METIMLRSRAALDFCIVTLTPLEMRAYRPARNIVDRFRVWLKTYSDFVSCDARLAAISGRLSCMAEDGSFSARQDL